MHAYTHLHIYLHVIIHAILDAPHTIRETYCATHVQWAICYMRCTVHYFSTEPTPPIHSRAASLSWAVRSKRTAKSKATACDQHGQRGTCAAYVVHVSASAGRCAGEGLQRTPPMSSPTRQDARATQTIWVSLKRHPCLQQEDNDA